MPNILHVRDRVPEKKERLVKRFKRGLGSQEKSPRQSVCNNRIPFFSNDLGQGGSSTVGEVKI